MELSEIKKKWETAEIYTTEKIEEYCELYVKEKEKWNPVILAEECSELIKVLTKVLRKIYDPTSNEDDRLRLIEEVTDVELTLRFVEMQFNIVIPEKWLTATKFSEDEYNEL